MQKKHPPKIPSHNGRTRQPHPARHPLHRHLAKIHLPKYFILGKTLYLIIKTMGQLEVELAKLHFGTIFVLRYEK